MSHSKSSENISEWSAYLKAINGIDGRVYMCPMWLFKAIRHVCCNKKKHKSEMIDLNF